MQKGGTCFPQFSSNDQNTAQYLTKMKMLALHSFEMKWTIYGVHSIPFIEALMITFS
jgi:hypothetical protein